MKILRQQPLKDFNTFGINAIADYFVKLETEDDYRQLACSTLLKEYPFFILGGGSNVILPDRYEGLVVHPANVGVRLLSDDGDTLLVEAQAGTVWADFVDYCIDHEWHGLENLARIPGCVGAAPVQNVGAYGREAKDVVAQVHYYDLADASERWIEGADCQFAYRHSIFKGALRGRCLIDRVRFRLQRRFTPCLTYKGLSNALQQRQIEAPTARQLADIVAAIRADKLPDPEQIGSAGSFFKNPVVSPQTYRSLKEQYPELVAFENADQTYKLAAGWLIEQCGWKGRALGPVAVYDRQALVLINRGGCSAADVRHLADAIIADVKARFGVSLDCEAIFVQ